MNTYEVGKQKGFEVTRNGKIKFIEVEQAFPQQGEWKQANLLDWGKLEELKKKGANERGG